VGEVNRTNHAGEATVADERTQESTNQKKRDHEVPGAEILRRRQNNREHMRRRRANPANWAREQEKRKAKQTATRGADELLVANVAQALGRVCALCHLRAAVEEITRLEPSTVMRGGYVQVRLPYCGRC